MKEPEIPPSWSIESLAKEWEKEDYELKIASDIYTNWYLVWIVLKHFNYKHVAKEVGLLKFIWRFDLFLGSKKIPMIKTAFVVGLILGLLI